MSEPTQYGMFVGTTNVWDVTQIYQTEVTSPEFKELLVRMYQNLNLMSTVLNIKDSAYYDRSEFVNGQLWFANPANNSSTGTKPTFRQVYRQVYLLPPFTAGTSSIAHGITITPNTTFTRIYGVANDTSMFPLCNFYPLPYVGPSGNDITLKVNQTNIVVIDIDGIFPGVNPIYVVLEYIQS